ncbi:hypothetical protein LCGC14_2712290 [marine sediment metagenome]|uniref:Uncharacterized protein n=1 Tax=marine sediment metagenome TaxID=412755 RepID=A0A0F9BLJ5_9ZZZZ
MAIVYKLTDNKHLTVTETKEIVTVYNKKVLEDERALLVSNYNTRIAEIDEMLEQW